MEHSAIRREFFQYTSQNMLGMMGLSCYILADTFFISQGLGADGLTALNLAIPFYNFIQGAGLMLGMGGATFPTHVKISSGLGKVDTVIINASECEPYITSDHRFLLEYPEDVIGGATILARVFGVDRVHVAVEDNKQNAAELLRLKIEEAKAPVVVDVLHTRYPQGAEKQLCQSITGRQVPPGALPAAIGCAVFNTVTTAAIYRAVYTGMPVTHRVVTVSGSGTFTMKLRVPYWATAGFTVSVNGDVVIDGATPSSYVAIERTWNDGDVVTVNMPYTVHLDKTPDTVDGDVVASLMYGPMVMVAKDTRDTYVPMNWYTVSANDSNLDQVVSIVEPAGTGETPHLTLDGLDFYPMYDAYNYRYHAYVKLLETKSVLNTQWLEEAVTLAEGITEDTFVGEDWNAFQTALRDAKALLNNLDGVTQEQLYNAEVALETAMGEGETPEPTPEANKTLLQKTYDYALTLSTDGVTDAAKAAFEDALANAKAVLADDKATQEEVNDAWDALLEGIWGLGLVQGDKDELNLLIAKAEAMDETKYVADYWPQLVDALAKAKDVAADGDAMEEDIQPVAQALLDAILAQRFKADKSILEDLLGKAESMDLTGYTAESVEAFRTALATAQAVLADESLTEDDQNTVDAAVEKLTRAMDGLTAEGETQPSDKPEATDQPEASQKPEATQKPENVPQTGDHSQVLLYMAALGGAAALMAGMAAAKRKERQGK